MTPRPGGRRRRGPLAAAALPLLLLAPFLAACGGTSGPSITLYNGQHEQTTDALVSAFEKATGINVEVQNGDEDLLADEIVSEGSHSPADVIFTENSQALELLQEKGLLAHVEESTLADTPSRYNSAAGDWVGVSARVSVIIYNPGLIAKSQLPTGVLQLANPKYKDKLAFAPAETDFQPIVTAVERAYGLTATLRWLEGIKANVPLSHQYPDNETIADEVNRGEVAFGVVNQYYWYRMRAEIGPANMHSAISYFAPHDPGYVVDISGAAVLASSKHQADAQRFVAFLTSRTGQEIISHSISFEYTIASGVSTVQPETPFDELQPYPITVSELGDGSEAISLLQRVGLL
ncbi:MAG TPA: extracellular solute-binding protein [Acidimicrobiales bacterium]|nr:extracellular solute-binding protein [Acidimicrobiales bacterium]